jgi:hypothetical protein
MASGFPAPVLAVTPSDGVITPTGSLFNSTYDAIPPDLHEGTLHSWNVSFQRQLPFGFSADIAYVGTRGVDLVMDVDRNASLVYGSGNAGRPQFAAFKRIGTTRTRTNLGKSQYHGLQLKVDRRFMHGLLVTNSYTFARSQDDANENGGIGTPIDFDLSWGRSDTDRRHNYVLSSVYELPWGPGRHWLNEGTWATVAGGWQVSGLFIAQSGQALTITGSGTLLNTPATRRLRISTVRTRFWAAADRGSSTSTRPVLAARRGHARQYAPPHRTRRAGFWQLDMSISKRFIFSSARYAEFRIDAYNVPNAVRWANPNTGFSTSTGNTFGQIANTTGSQRSLRFGLRFAF